MLGELALESEKINRRFLLKRLKDGNVKALLCSRLEEIGKDSVSVREKDTVRQLPFDHLILSVGVVPARPEWINEIRETGADVLVIGDAGAPGRLINAVSEGTAIGRSV
jgi:protein-L-isoaspartate O-methyltransferase